MASAADRLLVGSGCLLAASAAIWAVGRASAAPSAASARTPDTAVGDLYAPDLARCEPAAEGRIGDLRFIVEGVGTTGLSTAVLFKDAGGRPHWGQWTDVAGMQAGDRLVLGPWVDRRSPAGDHHLGFTLRTERDGNEEWVCGWATVSPIAVRTSALVVRPEALTQVEVLVRTESGQPVPGALVALDAHPSMPIGLATHFVSTGEDGAARVRGLKPGTWWVTLPDGVGPATEPVVRKVEVGTDPTVAVVVPGLTEPLRFVRHAVRFGLPGASARIERVEGASRTAVRVWPVARWIGPGRGPDAPLWLARLERDAAAAAGPVTIVFAERTKGDALLPTPDVPSVVTLPLDATQPPSVSVR